MQTTQAKGWRVVVNGEVVATYLSREKAAGHAEELRVLRWDAIVVVRWL
jgi:hypothetical protein